MSQPFQAIYENGLLRPLGPLALEQRQVVTVVIQPMPEQPAAPEPMDDVISRQQAGWLAFLARMEALPPEAAPAGKHNSSDEDDLIYGD